MATTMYRADSEEHLTKEDSVRAASFKSASEEGPSKEAEKVEPDATPAVAADPAPAETLTKREKVKRHFRRLWKWYLLEVVILLAILLPILFKVIMPAIVQNIVSGQALPVYAGYFKATSPGQTVLSLNTSFYSPFKAEIDPLPLHIYNAETTPYTPFYTIGLPQQFVGGTTPAAVPNETLTVENEAEMIKWLNNIFNEVEVPLSIRAWPVVRMGALAFYPYLDKTVSIRGLNGLKGFSAKTIQIMLPPENGNNIKGTLILPNAGVLTMDLGNLTLNVWSGNVRLGIVRTYNVVLPPGNSTVDFDGELYLNELGPNLGAILASQAAPLARGVVELNTTGNSTMYNGQHIKYVESVLNTKTLSLDISVVTLLSDVISGLLHGGSTSIVDVLGDIFGNTTFIDNVLDNWNTTSISTNGSLVTKQLQARKNADRSSMAWNMLKLGMKMKRASV